MSQVDVYTEPAPKPADVPVRIYSNPICPFAQRARLIAYAKGVPFEEINVHLKVKPDWFVEKINPYGKVPVVEHDGHIIRESLINFDYIDEVFGDKSLWPSKPNPKAQSRILVTDFGDKFIPNFYKHFRDSSDESALKELVNFFQRLEDVIKLHKEKFNMQFIGDSAKPGAVDYLIWPWIERTQALKIASPALGAAVTADKFPLVHDYISRMLQDAAVKKTALPPEKHLAFYKKMKESDGQHDYSVADLEGKGVTIYTKKQA